MKCDKAILNLVVFDIDGTLTNTRKHDLDWYLQALKDEFDVDATEATDLLGSARVPGS